MTTGQPLAFDVTPDELVLFMSEGEEQLELLSQDLLRLENEGDTNSELLQEIFRAAHTLKGSSGAIGHGRMAKLTHAVETVLDQVRHHTLPVTTHIIDLLLKSLDALRVLLEEVTTLVESDVAIDDLAAALNALAAGEASKPTAATSAAKAPPAKVVTPPAPATPPGIYQIQATIAPDCMLPAVRALQVLLAAGNLGTVTASDPKNEDIEGGNVKGGQVITLTLAATDTTIANVRKAVGAILEVTIDAVTTGGGSTAPSPAATTTATPTTEDTLWRIEADIAASCVLPAARALQIVLGLGEIGTVRDSAPSLEEIESGQVTAGGSMIVLLAATGSRDDVTAAAQRIIERILEVQFGSVEVADAEDLLTNGGAARATVAPPASTAPVAAAPTIAAAAAVPSATAPQPIAPVPPQRKRPSLPRPTMPRA